MKGKKTGGRQKGTPNKASLPWKQFAEDLAESPEHREALRQACLTDPNLYLRVIEHAFGKPRQSVDLNTSDKRWIQWPDKQDVAEEALPDES
jgi:hypothetical protein